MVHTGWKCGGANGGGSSGVCRLVCRSPAALTHFGCTTRAVWEGPEQVLKAARDHEAPALLLNSGSLPADAAVKL